MFYYFLFSYLAAFNCILVASNVAVVEYMPIDSATIPDNLERLAANIQNYIEILKGLPDTVDLVIYPESVLNTGLLASEINTFVTLGENPCSMNVDKYPQYIRDVACTALDNQKFIIINTIEKEECEESEDGLNCGLYGYKFYNCDIAFGTDGSIIGRYRKYNLFGEYDLDTPEVVDNTIITINGKKIGVFTCFDLLFQTPPEDLIAAGVQSIAFPTMWFSELPFLTALQAQQMWAHEHNIRLYAAGANNPERGSGGTGIYDGNAGPITFDIIAEGGSKSYTESSTKDLTSPTVEEIDELGRATQDFYLKHDNITYYSSVLLDVTKTSQQIYEVCHKPENDTEFCCTFTTKLSYDSSLDGNSYTYHLVAFSGIRTFSGVRDGGLDICGVVACTGDTLSDCGQRFSSAYNQIVWPVTFEELEIRANFNDDGHRTQFPDSLLSSIRPIHPVQTLWTKQSVEKQDGAVVERVFALKQSQNRLLTFAIYGRNFALDTKPGQSSSGMVHNVNVLLCFCMAFLIAVLLNN